MLSLVSSPARRLPLAGAPQRRRAPLPRRCPPRAADSGTPPQPLDSSSGVPEGWQDEWESRSGSSAPAAGSFPVGTPTPGSVPTNAGGELPESYHDEWQSGTRGGGVSSWTKNAGGPGPASGTVDMSSGRSRERDPADEVPDANVSQPNSAPASSPSSSSSSAPAQASPTGASNEVGRDELYTADAVPDAGLSDPAIEGSTTSSLNMDALDRSLAGGLGARDSAAAGITEDAASPAEGGMGGVGEAADVRDVE
ncbi:hypothetical protein HYH03_016062 [Edaphochlamys debaryana]|uniref:Uncharacterized protein n=1 Tax=Edaphochlamys debaryana TaxID=47281 RepID=A0A836BQM1_9CHLO|nr:hypothetical protein HYH03_016062 [Edaphochlamys debaryana]|eukprot:KAG2485172.1 hypothetical protein HYH03_016062 [Edaphochlamys debaryana]